MKASLVITFLLTIPFYELGTLTAIFNFTCSILILAHTPLFNAQLPPVIHSILLEILELARLDFLFNHGYGSIDEQSLFQEHIAGSSLAEDVFACIRVGCGYLDGYAEALTVTIFILLLLSVG